MTNETRDCKVSLKSQKKAISTLVCTLNVPNVFVLPEYDNTYFEVKSPPFEYANATWQFQIQADMDDIKNDTFYISLLRLNYTNPKQIIICTIELITADGEKYDRRCQSIIVIDDDDDDDDVNNDDGWYICGFNNLKPFYDRRDTLALTIHLISDESFEEHADQVPLMIKEDIETLSQDYKKLFLNGKKQDLTLKVADKEFRVHQDILMARCQVFEAMLTHDIKGKEKGVIHVSDCDYQAMEQFLFYVYSGKVETLNQGNVLGLYYVADKYQMMSLKEDCSEFIKQSLSPSMICDVVLLALNHSDADLLESATQYFVDHTSQILSTVGWLSFLKSNNVAANELLIKSTK